MVIFHYSHSIYISLIFFVDLKFIQPGPRPMRPMRPTKNRRMWSRWRAGPRRRPLAKDMCFSASKMVGFSREMGCFGAFRSDMFLMCLGTSRNTLTFSEHQGLSPPAAWTVFPALFTNRHPPKKCVLHVWKHFFENLIESLGINSKTYWTYSEI